MRRWKGLFFGAFLVLPFLVGCSSNNTNDATSYYEEEKSSVPEKVKVVWHNYDNSILQVDSVYTGTMPVYRGETPTREPTTSTEFTFTGWSPEVSGVYENTDYYAMYSSSVRKYTITWLNYDNSVISSQKVEYGETPVYSGSTPKRTSDTNSYTFKGWDPAVLPVTGNATYKATYSSTPIETTKYYEITWKNYDGSVLSKTSVKEGDTPVYDKSTPTRPTANRTEYTFDSWKPTPVPATQNATYTAQYTENYLGCVIYFDLNGGKSSCPLSKTVYSLSSSDFPYDVVKDGYNFRGWSYNGKTVFDESGKTVNSVQLVNGMTFVAIYSTSAKLTLISSVSGETDIVGGTISGAGDYSYHASVTINAYPFEGFTFQGWYDDSGVQISTTPEYNFVMWEKDTKLTAVFALKSYTLTLSSNSSTLGSVKDGTGSYSSSTSVSHKYTKSVTIYALNKTEDYEFLGWFNGEERVSSNAVYTFSMPCKNYSLVAKWDAFTYHVYQNDNYQDKATISFDSNGGSSVSSQAITPSTGLTCPTPTKTNAILRGWSWQKYKDDFYDFNSSLSFDSKLYARWEDNADTTSYINPLSYTSTSSYTSKSFTTSSAFWFNCLTSGTKYLYIRNTSSSYTFNITVKQNSGGYTSTVISSQTINYGSSYTALTFNGVAGAKYTVSISKSTSTSTTYYFYFTGFSASSAAKYTYHTGAISLGGYLDFSITRKGYTLTGLRDENGTTYTSSTKWNKYVDNAKLIAVWSANSYTINYHLNEGVLPSGSKTSYSYGTTYTLPTPTLGSLAFDGWYLESDYSGAKITNTDGFLSGITLYAKYIASTNLVINGIQVELYYSDQTSPFKTYSLATGESFGIPETPVRSGYVFCGWYKDSSCNTAYDFAVAPTSGIVKLYSKWSNTYSASSYLDFADVNSSNYKTISNRSSDAFYYVAKYSGSMTIYYKNSSTSSSYRSYVYITRVSNSSSLVSTYTYSNSYNSTTFNIVAGEVYRFSTSYYSSSATLYYYFSGNGTAPSATIDSLYNFATINFVYGQDFHIDAPAIDGFNGYYYYNESNGSFTKITDANGDSLSPFTFTKSIKIYSSASLNAFIGTANS